MARDFYLAAYDIGGVKRQAKTRERIRAYAVGGQKSVFECLLTASESDQLFAEMAMLLHPEADRFLLLHMDPRAKLWRLGRAAPPHFSACMYQG